MENKIRVEIRIKPTREDLLEIENNTIQLDNKSFTFDRIYDQSATQKEIFENSVRGMVDTFLEGFNSTVFVYGQTGSGKTYTMGISLESAISAQKYGSNEVDISKYGMVPQALSYIFSQEGYELLCSFIEIYNEDVIDLLSGLRNVLTLRSSNGETQITGIREYTIRSAEEGLALLKKGCLERTTKATQMNAASSRSHALFTLTLKKRVDRRFEVSKLSFVDLAGSERMRRTFVKGARVRESISINSGLLSLGNVIAALGSKQTHIPYRDSKLTRILQGSLGGNAHTLMLACISASSADLGETLNTLKYADRASKIVNQVKKNIFNNSVLSVMELRKEIQRLRSENERLKALIKKEEVITSDITKYEEKISNLAEERHSKCDGRCVEEIKRLNEIIKNGLSPIEETPSIKRQRKVKFADEIENISCINSGMSFVQPIKSSFIGETNLNMNEETHNIINDISPIMLNTPSVNSIIKLWGHTSAINSMALYNNNLITSSVDGTIRLWLNNTSEVIINTGSNIKCIFYDNLLYYTYGVKLCSYDFNSGSNTSETISYNCDLSSLKIFDNWICTGHEDGTINIYDRRNLGKVYINRLMHRGTVFSIDNIDRCIYSGSRDHTVGYISIDGISTGVLKPPHYDSVYSVFSFDKDLISLGRDCSLKRWSGEKKCVIKTIPYAHETWIRAGASGMDGFYSGSKDGNMKFWKYNGTGVACVSKFEIGASINSILECGPVVYAGCQDKSISIIKKQTNS
ncbi:Chromosome-associated kinesin KIF4 [Astathelohania contejeani]|uniref:Kinesin-like protein n=1 Tax=Astathelohania contejeani TaxID=164912 RepID=A0ABQ7I0E9_9MICR|nr:Chromosome-associated kinesin KIF4 [Thelohania contejeani]